jgi:hypothetical protein
MMEEIVRSYINSKPNGVRIDDMEEAFCHSRLRLGYITRKLLNEGKVIKVDNKYYPLTGKPMGKIK